MYGATAPSQPWSHSKEASIHCPQLFSSNLKFLGPIICPSIPALFKLFYLMYQLQYTTFTYTNITIQDMYMYH